MRIANAKLIVCTPDLTGYVVELFVETNSVQPCISLNLFSFEPLSLSTEELQNSQIVQIRYEDFAAVRDTRLLKKPTRLLKDIGALIYTSGTSGKPKAVSIKNFLLVLVSTPLPTDLRHRKRYFPLRVFSCLPLFHATCLFTGLYYSVGLSSTFCLSRKFSASGFSKELTISGATRMLYVGELCRYLLAAPISSYDKAHKCIVAAGNGLQRDIWEKFKRRYNIPEVREVYRSTEGIAKFDNFGRSSSGAGMVGYAGPLGRYLESDTYLVKYDPSTEVPYRDPATGFCVTARLGEPGEAIGRVRSMDFYNEYLNDPGANKLKLIENVFEKGDLFQRTGDLLVRDKRGWVRFHDRSGDTFRWRGENVSAGEVREYISRLPGVHDVSVYGVKLNG
jgi:acyl-CoA synthetase (AMP-forming)/AMP-acid ligase II